MFSTAIRSGVRASLAAMLLAALAACQTAPPKPILSPSALTAGRTQMLQWQGHFSIKLGPWGQQGNEGQSFTFYLQSDDQNGELDLMTPLGTQLAQVIWTPGGTRIESAQGTQHYTSLSELSEQLLGEDVPLQALPHWLQGLPSPDLPHATVLADHTGFEQAGWAISAQGLPEGKLQATREQTATQRHITIKVRLER